ncbi:PASTA domain-containing protein, partial [Brevibacterium casei]
GSGGSGTGGGSRGAGDDDPAPVAAGAAHTRRRRRRRLATTVGAGLVVLVLLAWLIIANLPAPTSIVPGQLAGKEFSEATEVVESSGLNPEKQEVFDDSIPAGTVIGSEPVGGTELSPDSTVTLVVSKGVETFAVPELEGLSAEKAKAALDDAGLGVGKVDEKYDENVAKGIVISASEKEGEELVHDAKVDLVVSKGDAPVEVPDVEGLTYDAAFATLTKRGFRVGKEEVFSDTVPKGKVVFQWPKSTEAKPYNSLVIVRVSKGKEEKKDDKPKDEKPKDEKKDEGK